MWAGIVLASLAAFLITVLCVPLDVELRLDIYGKPRARGKLIWLFGLLSKELKKGAAPKRVKPKNKLRDIGLILELVRIKDLPGHVGRFLKWAFSSLRIKQLEVDFRVGLGDPADTGLLFATIGPTRYLLTSIGSCNINMMPSFDVEAVLEGYLMSVVRVSPLRLAGSFLRFGFSIPTARMIKKLILYRWRRKKR
ncbi:DUF2953 domain-containing protein [Chloroflexota bacterium]